MEMLKFGKFAALALAMAVAVGARPKAATMPVLALSTLTLVTAPTLVLLTVP